MTNFLRPIAFGLMVAAATASFADEGTVSPQRIEMTAPSPAVIAARAVAALPNFESSYEMSSGRRLVVTATDGGLRVKYGRLPTRVLHHDGQGAFVSTDGQLVVKFELDQLGEPELVRMSLPASMI